MPAPEHFVRPAQVADARELARIQAAAWTTYYPQLLPRPVIMADLIDPWAAAIADPRASHQVLVATDAGPVVGFAAVVGQAEGAELTALIVHPQSTRQGHGSRLLNASADLARAQQFTRLHTWTLELDSARQAFFLGAGLTADGARRWLADDAEVSVGEVSVGEVCWSAALMPSR